MKTGKKILLTALSATLVAGLTSGLALTAFADTATKDHEYDAKNDAVFEDFDRAEISDTVTASGAGVDLGERPYLHIEYTADQDNPATTAAAAIYKQGSGSLGEVSSGGTITLTMRSPDSSVDLSELYFGARGIDQDNQVFGKTFDQLKDSENDPLGNITAEWQTFEISFTNSYEDEDVFPNSSDKVTGKPLLAIHIYVAEEAEGTLDIASVEYSTTGENKPLNEFRGAGNVLAMAQAADSATWWADSNGGTVVKRAVKMTGDSFTVVKDSPVGDYTYAIIEAEGDVENLKVATTTDGEAWENEETYDGYSVALTGQEKGFKFSYDGEESVTVKRIYLTKLEVRTPMTAIPVIDATTADLLDDFSVAQSTFPSEWEDMSNTPEMVQAGMNYRIGYHNGDKVKIENGELVFDATDDYIQFKFMSKTASYGKYIVFKMKTDDDATLDNFRFALGRSDDVFSTVVIYANQLKAGYQKAAALLDDGNPYKDGDWYYVVADIEESGFPVSDVGYGGLDLYWTGTSKLHIDEIFFADKLPDIEKQFTTDTTVTSQGTTGYAYAGYLYIPNQNGKGVSVEFDITPAAEGFNPSKLRLEFSGVGTYWGDTNAEGTLLTADGKKLVELTYTAGQATHVVIDLAKSGIVGSFSDVHVHTENIGAFTLDNVVLNSVLPAEEVPVASTEKQQTVDKTVNFTATVENNYQYADGIDVPQQQYAKLAFDITPAAEGFNPAELRLAFGEVGTYWGDENAQGTLLTADGKKLVELTYTAGQATHVEIDLAKSGVDGAFNVMHIHTNGTGTGSFTMNNIVLTYVEYEANPYYAEQLELLAEYLDNVAPTVDITTATTAKADDQITVAYTVSDNATPTADLDITVSVTKDGNAVALTGNKFTAAEGVYTVTVTVRDLAGNEATDTIQITVSAKEEESSGGSGAGEGETPAPPAEGANCAGCGTMTMGGGLGLGGGMALLVISMLAVTHILRKKKQH